MTRRRLIVVNPALDWIQGDLFACAPAEALSIMVAVLGPAARDVEWTVHETPPGFPAVGHAYAGNDPALLETLRGNGNAPMRAAALAAA